MLDLPVARWRSRTEPDKSRQQACGWELGNEKHADSKPEAWEEVQKIMSEIYGEM